MYYLQSRYYDPEICRFINADEFASTGQGVIGYNMFAYCNNNPTNCVDSNGESALLVSLIIIGVCAVVGAVLGATCDRKLVGSFQQDSVDSGLIKNSTRSVVEPITPNNASEGINRRDSTSRNSPIRQESHVNVPDISTVVPTPDSQNNQSAELTVGDRIVNGMVGFFAGAAAGGLLVAGFGACATIFAGASLQTFAIGTAAFDAFGCVAAPFLGTTFEPIALTP